MKFCTTDEALVQWLRLSSGIRGLGSNPPALFPLLKSHPPLLREKKKDEILYHPSCLSGRLGHGWYTFLMSVT